jgi:hypothetical protein
MIITRSPRVIQFQPVPMKIKHTWDKKCVSIVSANRVKTTAEPTPETSCMSMSGVSAQGDPCTTTISDLLCIPIWFQIIPDSSTRALRQSLPAETSSSKAGEICWDTPVEFCLWVSLLYSQGSLTFRKSYNMGLMALLPLWRKSCYRLSLSLKIYRTQPGLNLRILAPVPSMLPLNQRVTNVMCIKYTSVCPTQQSCNKCVRVCEIIIHYIMLLLRKQHFVYNKQEICTLSATDISSTNNVFTLEAIIHLHL